MKRVEEKKSVGGWKSGGGRKSVVGKDEWGGRKSGKE